MNRRAFVDRLDAEVARASRYGREFGLVLCDLDGFKGSTTASAIRPATRRSRCSPGSCGSRLRKPDDAFRIGGDEFALLLAEASEEDTREVIGRIQTKVERPASGSGACARASASPSCPADAADAQALFRLADEALYEAKRAGTGIHFVA